MDRCPANCPKCGGANVIYFDQLAEEWACRWCGWRSGQRPATPVVPDPLWPHQRLWTHKK